MTMILSFCICVTTWAGETTFTSIATSKQKTTVTIDAEGTNEIGAMETFDGWTPVFLPPAGGSVAATIMQFDTPKPGGGKAVFKIKYVVTDPNGTGMGSWRARSELKWKTGGGGGSHIKDSNKVNVP